MQYLIARVNILRAGEVLPNVISAPNHRTDLVLCSKMQEEMHAKLPKT